MLKLDELDRRAAGPFEGYLVRKDLVRKYSRQYPVPTYVVEFLLGRYCATTDEAEIVEGLAIVERQLKDRTVRTGDQELFKAHARERGSIKLIDIVRARLDARTDSVVAELPSLGVKDVCVDDFLVKEHERMLTDGFNATGQRGLVCQYDVVCFDEISGVSFDQRDGVNILKGYMESGEFSGARRAFAPKAALSWWAIWMWRLRPSKKWDTC